MRYFKLIIALLLVIASVVSCKMKKELTLEDYAKIENEVNLPNPEINKQKVEETLQKYGYTYQQYKDMFNKVEKDPKLREKLGEIRLQTQKTGNK
jgi:Holliday junction resolvasome RuvABC DNA-binding subunit